MANSSLARSTLLHVHKLCGTSRSRALSPFNLAKRPLGVNTRSNQTPFTLLQVSKRFERSLSGVRFYSSSSSSGNDDADDPIKTSVENPGSPLSGNICSFKISIKFNGSNQLIENLLILTLSFFTFSHVIFKLQISLVLHTIFQAG
jgi:hypothetical protein